MALTHHDGFSLEDLEAMDPHERTDGRRYELIGGSIVVNPSPQPRHQVALGNLYDLLRPGCPTGHRFFFAPMDLDLVGQQRVQPDLLLVPTSSIGEQRLQLPVLLTVELVSASSAVWDQVAKRAAYEESGIEHYWIVDTRPGSPRFTALRLDGSGRYQTVADSTERIEVDEPVPISESLARLFAV